MKAKIYKVSKDRAILAAEQKNNNMDKLKQIINNAIDQESLDGYSQVILEYHGEYSFTRNFPDIKKYFCFRGETLIGGVIHGIFLNIKEYEIIHPHN